MMKIALIDDHVVLRKSLAILIQMYNDFEIVLQADNGYDFIRQLETATHIPDIVVLDITMPEMGGLETARWLKSNHPKIKVIVLTMLRNEDLIIRMLKNGARAYILKDADPDELREALRTVYATGYYFNDILTPELKRKGDGPRADIQLTAQELIFVRWSCTELTYRQIADKMNVSHRTVDGYRDTLFRKLHVSTRVGIVLYAIRNNLQGI